MTDSGAFRFEYVCEAVAPDGSRTRVGSFAISSVCLLCGRSPVVDDYATGTASIDGGTLATINNQPGIVCVTCTRRERARR